MNYELAKELKDAGFEQPIEGEYILYKGNVLMIDGSHQDIPFGSNELPDDTSGMAYIPTLSELIEACGDEFRSLRYEKPFYWAIPSYAEIPLYYGDKPSKSQKGNSPKEAVAMLWLVLNKK